jgi:hypothetical protein
MITQQHLTSINHADRELYARENVLNSAIIAADISGGWEEYLEIFDAFYADHVEVSDGTEGGAVFGKERMRALLFKFLVPIHVMAEIGGLSVQIRESPIHGDTADETHSAWSLGSDRGVRQGVPDFLVHSSTMGRFSRGTRKPLRPPANRRASNHRRSSSESVTGGCGRPTAVLAVATCLAARSVPDIEEERDAKHHC